MSDLVVKHRRRFGIVPDHILENKLLSFEARTVAAWLSGRQNGFVIKVETMKSFFIGLSDKRWKSAREQLERVGWWRSSRIKLANGKFAWRHEFSDEGFDLDSEDEEDSPGPPLRMDGHRTDEEGRAAESESADKPDNHKDRHKEFYQSKTTTTTKSSKVVADIDEILEAAFWQQQCKGKPIGNIPGWRHGVRKRLETHGASTEDINTLILWRAVMVQKNGGVRQAGSGSSTEQVLRRKPTAEEMKKLRDAIKPSESSSLHAEHEAPDGI